jgi:hypothetical protein
MIRYYFAVLLKVTWIIQGPQVNKICITKKTAIILPDSTIDNGHDRELDCNDTDSQAKNIYINV